MSSIQIPPENKTWPGMLYSVGLMVFAIACHFSISLSQIGLSLALIGAIAMYRRGELSLKDAPLKAPFLFMTFAAAFSIFQAPDKLKAISDFPEYMIIFAFYLSFWPRIKDSYQRKLFIAFVVTATLTAILSLIDVAMGKVLQNRAKGFFSLSITFGECQAIVATTVLTWILIGKNTWKQFAGLALSFVLIFASLITSMARGAWLGFIAGYMILTIRFPKKMIPISLVLCLIGIPVVLSVPSLQTRLNSFSISKNLEVIRKSRIDGSFESAGMNSNFIRLNIWSRGFKISEDSSSFGVGLNNVKKKYYDLCTDFEKKHDFLIFGHQHNNFMQMLLMTGLLGLTAFFYFLVEIFRFFYSYALRNPDSWNQTMSVGAIAVFACFIVTGFTEFSWGDEEVIMMAFYITGLMMNKAVTEDN
jgi:O-antigen ligase